jgi:hypothetical protein
MSNILVISWRDQVTLDEMIMMMSSFVLDQHVKLDFNSASSLKQQSASLGNIILIRSQPNFALTL